MTATEILKELKPLGKESYKKLMMKNYGVKEPYFGVAINELKKFQKRIKMDYQLALDLYDTGNYDAMYLAVLIADDARMTKKDLQRWVEKAYAGWLCGGAAWVAAGNGNGRELALKWIESKKPQVAAAGWATFSSLVSIKDDADLDIAELKRLLNRVQQTIHDAPDAVRYHMNAFVIAVGSYVKPLSDYAIKVGEKVGPVTADLGDNNCQVCYAPDYIRKVAERGTIGKKRKSAKC